ncbi:MAG: aquaporin [Chitinophagaceae bacterium]|nr:aquaporin [Chitinophagaceae bacterium]
MRKYIVEFIGTFFLLSGAAFAGSIGASLALMVMIYAGGHISGAHYNPAITLAMYIRRKVLTNELPGYFIAQLLAAATAGALIYYVFEQPGFASCDGFTAGIIKTSTAEVIGTFALAYVVLNVATARGTAGNSFYGLAIGGTVLGMAIIFGRFSGGVFNPAVGLGLAVQKSICWKQLWLYFVAPLVGAALAAIIFRIVNEADEEEPESIPEEPPIKIEDRGPH